MQEKDKNDIVDAVVKALDKSHQEKTESYMKKHYCYLNDKFGIDFDDPKQVEEFRGGLKFLMGAKKAWARAVNIIGTTILVGILTFIGLLIKLGLTAINK